MSGLGKRLSRAEGSGGPAAVHVTRLFAGETQEGAWTAEHGDRKPGAADLLVFIRKPDSQQRGVAQ